MSLMNFTRTETVAFTGHRNLRFAEEEKLRGFLRATIEKLYQLGKRNFISGLAIGFDLMAAEEVLLAKKRHADILLIGAIPFPEQAARYPFFASVKYKDIRSKLDKEVMVSYAYHTRCYLERDVWMISKSSFLVAYYDGRRHSGTEFTVNRAKKIKLPMVNLFECM